MSFAKLLWPIIITVAISLSISQAQADYDQRIELLISEYPADSHHSLRIVLENWKDKRPALFENENDRELKRALNKFYQSEKRIIEKHRAGVKTNNNVLAKAGAPLSTTPANYNEPGYEFDMRASVRHLGVLAFEDSTAYLVRIKTPDGFHLQQNFGRSMVGQYIEKSAVEGLIQDRNRVYDLLAEELPVGTSLRVLDVFQRDHSFLFVRFETASNEISADEVVSMPIIDRVYRVQRIMPHQRSATYDSIGGGVAKVKNQAGSWSKDTAYRELRAILAEPEYSFTQVQIELSPTGEDSWESVEARLASIVKNFAGFDDHPYQQFPSSLNADALSSESNALIRDYDALTLELLEALYASDEVLNIIPKP